MPEKIMLLFGGVPTQAIGEKQYVNAGRKPVNGSGAERDPLFLCSFFLLYGLLTVYYT